MSNQKVLFVADTAFIDPITIQQHQLLSVFPKELDDGAYRTSLDELLFRSKLQSAYFKELLPKLIPVFKKYMLDDFLNNYVSLNSGLKYDSEILPSAFNRNFFNEIKKMAPFGNGNPLPTFLIKDLKIIKSTIIKDKYISCILKSKIGLSIKSIFFDSSNKILVEHLLNYKKNLSVIGQINENFWNNKKTLQLIIKDLVL